MLDFFPFYIFPFPVPRSAFSNIVGGGSKRKRKTGNEKGEKNKRKFLFSYSTFMSAGQCSVLSLSFLMCLVSCSVGEATPEQTDQRIVFYVFGSENIYIIDPKSKEVSSTIGPDGVCTKSNNRFSR